MEQAKLCYFDAAFNEMNANFISELKAAMEVNTADAFMAVYKKYIELVKADIYAELNDKDPDNALLLCTIEHKIDFLILLCGCANIDAIHEVDQVMAALFESGKWYSAEMLRNILIRSMSAIQYTEQYLVNKGIDDTGAILAIDYAEGIAPTIYTVAINEQLKIEAHRLKDDYNKLLNKNYTVK